MVKFSPSIWVMVPPSGGPIFGEIEVIASPMGDPSSTEGDVAGGVVVGTGWEGTCSGFGVSVTQLTTTVNKQTAIAITIIILFITS
jgi:hypothetical protein